MRRVWKNYNLSIVLATLFVISWVIQTWTGWMEFAAEQASHGQSAQVWGSSGYVWNWGRTTFENWQIEMLQLFTMVVLTSFLVHRGSAESRDSDEEMQRALERIEDRLNNMDAGPTGATKTPWEPTVRAG